MASIKSLTISIILVTMVGLLLCWYAFFVEMAKEQDNSYEALCDINEHMSCSKVFNSRYGRGFGLVGRIAGENSPWNQPNPIFGAALYISILMMTQGRTANWAFIQVLLCIIANIGSIYLAIILFVVLKDFCVVCVSTYLVNLVLYILCYQRFKILTVIAQATAAKAKKIH